MELHRDQDILRNTIDSSLDMIQVFRAVRNDKDEIVDFIWILNNKTSEKKFGDVIGKSLLTLNPGVVETGIFETFKKVVETGQPDESIRHYVHEQFNGWFQQSSVKQGDGVATTTRDITAYKKGIEMRISAARAAERRIRKLEAEQQREIFRVSLSTLEEERRQISERLHNGIGQILYGIKISMSALHYGLDESVFKNAKSYTDKLLKDAIDETRRISHELMPINLEQFGLKSAIEEICVELSGSTTFKFNIKGPYKNIENYLQLAVYRTVQELMLNVIEHAHATHCSINVEVNRTEILIAISDDGRGINILQTQKADLGLTSILSNIKLLNGDVHINAAPRGGTVVNITIPRSESIIV